MSKIMWDKQFDVNYHEIDNKKRALITSIMNYFEDTSMEQSENLGVGLNGLKEKNLAWVLYKWDIEIKRYPIYGEKIICRTIPVSCRKFYAYRKFLIIDNNDDIVAEGNSIWFLIDISKRKPVRVTDDMKIAYGLEESKEEPFKIERIRLDHNDFTLHKNFEIRYSDIDTNNHVNNVKYASWIIETIPIEILRKYTLNRIIINYEKELTYGVTADIRSQIIQNEGDKLIFIHKILNEEGKQTTLAKTYWSV